MQNRLMHVINPEYIRPVREEQVEQLRQARARRYVQGCLPLGIGQVANHPVCLGARGGFEDHPCGV
jgi:hypothetical protein